MNLKEPEYREKLSKQKCWPTTLFFATYQWRDLRRHKCHFTLAFCSTFFIVLSTLGIIALFVHYVFLLVVTSIISKGPVMFLKLCQDSYGEIDAFLTPAGSTSLHPNIQTYLNFTSIEMALKN